MAAPSVPSESSPRSCTGKHCSVLLSFSDSDAVPSECNIPRCAVMRAALVVLLSVCEHPVVREWISIMPDAGELAQSLQHLSAHSELLCEAGHTLAAMISGQYMLQPLTAVSQSEDLSSWRGKEQQGDASEVTPQLSAQAQGSTGIELLPVCPTPEPTMLPNSICSSQYRCPSQQGIATQAPGAACESGLPPQYPTHGVQTAQASQQHPAAFRSLQDLHTRGRSSADYGRCTNADGVKLRAAQSQHPSAIPSQVCDHVEILRSLPATSDCNVLSQAKQMQQVYGDMCRTGSLLQGRSNRCSQLGRTLHAQSMSTCHTMAMLIDGSCLAWILRLQSCWTQ